MDKKRHEHHRNLNVVTNTFPDSFLSDFDVFDDDNSLYEVPLQNLMQYNTTVMQ